MVLGDGTVIVADGVAVDTTLDVAGLNFSLNGGDAYPAAPNTSIGICDQHSLQNYLTDGTVSGADYPQAGLGRITIN